MARMLSVCMLVSSLLMANLCVLLDSVNKYCLCTFANCKIIQYPKIMILILIIPLSKSKKIFVACQWWDYGSPETQVLKKKNIYIYISR